MLIALRNHPYPIYRAAVLVRKHAGWWENEVMGHEPRRKSRDQLHGNTIMHRLLCARHNQPKHRMHCMKTQTATRNNIIFCAQDTICQNIECTAKRNTRQHIANHLPCGRHNLPNVRRHRVNHVATPSSSVCKKQNTCQHIECIE